MYPGLPCRVNFPSRKEIAGMKKKWDMNCKYLPSPDSQYLQESEKCQNGPFQYSRNLV